MKLKVLIALIFSSGILYASEDTQTDIVPRVVNFLIFASIIYYLLADKIKEFFKNRKDEISAKLESVQVKVKESKKRREDSAIKVEEAKKLAAEIVSTAKKEANFISENISKSLDSDIENLEKHHREQIELEKRKMTREVVAEVLNEMFEDGAITINEKEFTNIIAKRIAS